MSLKHDPSSLALLEVAVADIVRVLRVIEYVGTRDWVSKVVAASIHGTKTINQDCFIKAATIGDYPEILEERESKNG